MDKYSIEVLLKVYGEQVKRLEDRIQEANNIIERHRLARDLRKLKEKVSLLEAEQRKLQIEV